MKVSYELFDRIKMHSFETKLADWVWDIVFCDEVEVHKVSKDYENLLQSLKERLTIDRRAALFFKESAKKEVDWTLKKLSQLNVVSNFLLDLSEESAVINSVKRKTVLDEIWEFTTEFKSMDSDKLFPKEFIIIRKHVTDFMKSCVTRHVILPKLKTQTASSTDWLFNIELISSDILETSKAALELRMIPSSISLQQQTDMKYVEEVIEADDYFEVPAVDNVIRQPQILKLRTEEYYKLYENYVFTNLEPHTINFINWRFELSQPDIMHFKSLENHYISEFLMKGIEFRVDPPFMSDAPVFKEFLSAFEFGLSKLPPSSSVSGLKLALLSEYTGELKGVQFVEEIIKLDDLNFLKLSEPTFEKIRTWDHQLLGNISAEHQYRAKIPDNIEIHQKESIVPYICDSNVRIFETTDISTETEDTRDVNSLAATKMLTLSEMTPEHKTKRLIDEEIDTLMWRKKRNISHNNTDMILPPLLSLLKDTINEEADRNIILKTFDTPKLQIESVAFKPEFDSSNVIIFNTCFMNENSKLLLNLHKFSKLNILEYNLNSGPDFLISQNYGVFILSSAVFDQVDIDGNLKVQSRVLENLQLLEKLHVIIIYDGTSSKELLLTFQLTLSMMDITSVIVSSDVNSISDEICSISYFEGLCKNDQELGKLEGLDCCYLIDCGINPFVSLEILKKADVLEFLTMNKDEMDVLFHSLLTKSSIEKSYELFNLSWSIS